MKKPVRHFSILIAILMVAFSACSPKHRENVKTAKPAETVQPTDPSTDNTDQTNPDTDEPDDSDNTNPDDPVVIDLPDDTNPIDPLPDDPAVVSATPVVSSTPVVSTPVIVDHEMKDGDIIFQKSQSKQSKAIREASGSEWTHVGILMSHEGEWYVAEAIGPVVTTKLQDFIDRGKDKEYKVYRYEYFDSETMRDQLVSAIKKQNKSYDIYFEFSDDKTYCSELVYKAMLDVTGHELGHVQQYKDLKLNGPQVQALIQRRLTDKGRGLNVDEPIITPASQMADKHLTLIKESLKSEWNSAPKAR